MISELLVIFLVSVLLLFGLKSRRKVPPGPPQVPILGSIPFLKLEKGVGDYFLDECVTRNKISTVAVGPRFKPFIINDFELAKELFSKDEFSGRPTSAFHKENLFFGNSPEGLIQTEGSHWSAQRRFSLKTLKDFGFGKQSLETTVNNEIDLITDTFLANEGEDYLLSQDFSVPIINILWQLIAGYRFTKENDHGLRVVESVNEAFATGFKSAIYPLWFQKLFPKVTGYGRKVQIFKERKNYFMAEIKKHQDTLDDSSPRDYIDMYLIGMKSNKALTLEDLAVSLGDMFVAGTETSSTTLKWTLMYLCLHPDVQTKCREEIRRELDTERFQMSDLPRLPYTQATLIEIQRVARVAPASLPHKTTAPTKVGEFSFPPDSIFMANLSFITHDPSNIEDPFAFKPDRWIDEAGRLIKNERLIPFGIGKRTCMGELLARNEICLFAINLIQRIQFLPPKHNPQPDPSKYLVNLTRIPDDFHIRFERVK